MSYEASAHVDWAAVRIAYEALLGKQMNGPIDKQATLLGTMAKTLEKLMELEKLDAAQRPTQKDLTELRSKVAKRIEQLSRNDVG